MHHSLGLDDVKIIQQLAVRIDGLGTNTRSGRVNVGGGKLGQ